MKKIFLFLAMMVISSLSFAQSQPTDCKTGIERCGPQVKPPGCPPGKHWSNKEKGFSRCVSDVPPPGSCANGASDYPICTPSKPGCANGASDYPTCTPPKCPNGAPDYPTCSVPTPTCPNGTPDYPTCQRFKRYYCAISFQGNPSGYIEGYDKFFVYAQIARDDEADKSDIPIDFIGVGGFVFRYFKGQILAGRVPANGISGWTGYFYDDGADSVRGTLCSGGNGN